MNKVLNVTKKEIFPALEKKYEVYAVNRQDELYNLASLPVNVVLEIMDDDYFFFVLIEDDE